MTETTPLDEAVAAGLISERIAVEARRMMAEWGESASYVCGLTGGEPMSEEQIQLVRFLEERERD